MRDPLWDLSEDEAGFTELLAAVEERRRSEDRSALGHALLVLAHRVKWVRSDTAQDPFTRSAELYAEAVAVFRSTADQSGLLAALCGASALKPPEIADGLLAEAAHIADALDDDNLKAKVLNRTAASLGMRDPARAAALNVQAADLYERVGNFAGLGHALFGLALQGPSDREKQRFSIRGADAFERAGDLKMVYKCLMLAWVNGEVLDGPLAQEPIIKRALDAAQTAADRSGEATCYFKLAQIARMKGDIESAERYQRWYTEMESADGPTPKQRRREQRDFERGMKVLADKTGLPELKKLFGGKRRRTT